MSHPNKRGLPSGAADHAGPLDASYRAGTETKQLDIIALKDLEANVAKIVPRGAFDYMAGGSGDEWTMAENIAAFQRVAIEPRYLSGTGAPDLSTTLLGTPLSLPVITAPCGGHRLAHAEGEAATAKGTHAAGSLMIASTVSNISMEEIAASSEGPKWFQLYFPRDPGLARELIARARAAGYGAIVVTVDTVVPANRERLLRSNFTFPALGRGNVPGKAASYRARVSEFKNDLDWNDIALVQKESGLPVMLKGVLSAALAKESVARGMAAVYVSNHGGRQLDGVPGAFTALPKVVTAVEGRVPVILDGGVRRGIDVFKALAAGADCVALGRPLFYGLALGGAPGIESVYNHIRGELATTMHLAGARNVGTITRDFLAL